MGREWSQLESFWLYRPPMLFFAAVLLLSRFKCQVPSILAGSQHPSASNLGSRMEG
jgi:hypothetical protein